MDKNRRLRRSALSYATQLGYTAITLAVGIIATPRLIRWLGNEQLGTVRTAGDWAGYLSLVELGLGGATTAVLAGALNSGKTDRLEKSVWACFHAYRWVAIGMLALGAVLVLIIPHLVLHAGSVSPLIVEQLRWATGLGAIAAPLIIFSPIRVLWEVDQRGYVVSIVLIVQTLVTTTASLLLAYAGFGIVGQALATVVGSLAYYGVFILCTRWAYPWVFHFHNASDVDEHSKALRRLNWPTLALTLANRMSFLSDNLVIAYFFGPSMVVPFFLTQRLVQIAQSQSSTIANVTWAGLIQLRQTEGLDLFNRRLLEITRLIVLLGLAALVPVFAYDECFVRWWVGEKQFGGTFLVFLAAFNSIALSVPAFWGWVFSGSGMVAKLVPVSLAAAGVNVAVSISATYLLGRWKVQMGMLGPLIGTTAAALTCYAWWTPLLLKRHFGTSISSIIIAVSRPVLVAAPFAVLLFAEVKQYPPHGLLALGAEMSASSLILIILFWCFGIDRHERSVWRARFAANLAASKVETPPNA